MCEIVREIKNQLKLSPFKSQSQTFISSPNDEITVVAEVIYLNNFNGPSPSQKLLVFPYLIILSTVHTFAFPPH